MLIYLAGQLVVGIETIRINNQFYARFGQKLLVKGEIIEMEYFNITFPDVNFNILERDLPPPNIILHLYNLTISDSLTNSFIYRSLGIDIIERFDIQIGDVILFYKNPPFIKTKGK
ncbi:hypothetical protein LCGC14_1272380 [marine sediment metagenome]|uniref:Uncharacterized protein n=1 Tax=marine sediment metagenome TaxID=412755 RepID=A0A0F9LIU3_9ZZZZ